MYPVVVNPDLINHELKYNPAFVSNFSTHQNFATEIGNGEVFRSWNTSADSVDVPDFLDAQIKFLNDILLEEGLDETPATYVTQTRLEVSDTGACPSVGLGYFLEYRALQATENSLYDALGERYTLDDHELLSSLHRNVEHDIDGFDGSFSDSHGVNFHYNGHTNYEPKVMPIEMPLEPFLSLDDLSNSFLQLNSPPSFRSSNSEDSKDRLATFPVSKLTSEIIPEKEKKLVARPRRKKSRQRDEIGDEDGRGNKQQASSYEDYIEKEEFDDILLCREDKADTSTPKSRSTCRFLSTKPKPRLIPVATRVTGYSHTPNSKAPI